MSNIKEVLQDAFTVYKQANFRVFTTMGLIVSLLLIFIFSIVHFFNFDIGGVSVSGGIVYFTFNILLALGSAIFASSLFWMIGKNYGPKIGYLLVTNKILKIVFTKGDSHYFEKLGESERKVKPGLAVSKFINLLLSWMAVSAFLIGTILPLFDGLYQVSGPSDRIIQFLTSDTSNILPFLLKLIFVYVLSPVLLIIVIPIPWMLIDTQLKSYSSGLMINNLVGRLVQQRVTSIFAIGGIVSLVLISPTLDLLLALIGFIIIFVGLPASLVAFLYNLLFQLEFYDEFIKTIPVPYGLTQIIMESKSTEKISKENKDTDDAVQEEFDDSNQEDPDINNNNES